MKLLLTSAGFTNKSIVTALQDLLDSQIKDSSIAFIPTAANVEPGSKNWLIDDLINIRKAGFKEIDIVDFSALPSDVWLPRLETADVLMFGGGNTFHLMHEIHKARLNVPLETLLKTKVYVGVSAGSIIVTKSLELSSSEKLYSESIGEITNIKGLGFVDFHIRPHLNSPHFPSVTEENIRKLTSTVSDPIYAIDDQTAIQVVDGEIKVVSEGDWVKV